MSKSSKGLVSLQRHRHPASASSALCLRVVQYAKRRPDKLRREVKGGASKELKRDSVYEDARSIVIVCNAESVIILLRTLQVVVYEIQLVLIAVAATALYRYSQRYTPVPFLIGYSLQLL